MNARQQKHRRRGYVLVLFALLLVALLGLLGVVVDSGLLMGQQRYAQNAADSAARAAALHLRAEGSEEEIRAIVEKYVFDYFSVPDDGQVVINHPPVDGAYTGQANFVEVIVTYPVPMTFMRILGQPPVRNAVARAVAGFEFEERYAGLVVLDPEANPGLNVSGTNATLNLDSAVLCFSRRVGENEYGAIVGDIAAGRPAAEINGSGATIVATEVIVSGGVDDADNFAAPNVGKLHAGTLDDPWDPFHIEGNLVPTPRTANGVVNIVRGAVSVTENSHSGLEPPNQQHPTTGVVTLNPGIYERIQINGGEVYFKPGIYVLRPPQSGGGSVILSITGGTVYGDGVMFYNTGHDYNAATGVPDIDDEAVPSKQAPAPGGGTKFGRIAIHGENVTFTGINQSDNPDPTIRVFDDLLIYQRRMSQETINVSNGMPPPDGLQGILYAKWGQMNISGQGTYNFGAVLGSLSVTGNAVVTIRNRIPIEPRISPVRLVE